MESNHPKCKCHSLSAWAEDPDVPIQYDKVLNEYHLVGKNNRQMFFYYCPMCGGHLPKSRREKLFTKPSAREIAKIRKKVEGTRKMDDILAILGEPDEVYGAISKNIRKGGKYKVKGVKRTVRYTSLAKTLNVLLQEYDDNSFAVMFEGKFKPDAARQLRKIN